MNDKIREALAGGGIIDITTTGRSSGEPRRIEIAFHNLDGRLYISGLPRPQKRNWLANMEKNSRFIFHLKRDVTADLQATARPITDPAERQPLLEKIGRVWQPGDIEVMVRQSPLVEVTLDGF